MAVENLIADLTRLAERLRLPNWYLTFFLTGFYNNLISISTLWTRLLEGVGCRCFEGVSLDSDIDFCEVDKGKSSPLLVWSLYVSRGCAAQDVGCQGVAVPMASSLLHPRIQMSPLTAGYRGNYRCLSVKWIVSQSGIWSPNRVWAMLSLNTPQSFSV